MGGWTVEPHPFWPGDAELVEGTDRNALAIGYTDDGRAVECGFRAGSRMITSDPGTLRGFAEAFARWADRLETELARPPRGQTGLSL